MAYDENLQRRLRRGMSNEAAVTVAEQLAEGRVTIPDATKQYTPPGVGADVLLDVGSNQSFQNDNWDDYSDGLITRYQYPDWGSYMELTRSGLYSVSWNISYDVLSDVTLQVDLNTEQSLSDLFPPAQSLLLKSGFAQASARSGPFFGIAGDRLFANLYCPSSDLADIVSEARCTLFILALFD